MCKRICVQQSKRLNVIGYNISNFSLITLYKICGHAVHFCQRFCRWGLVVWDVCHRHDGMCRPCVCWELAFVVCDENDFEYYDDKFGSFGYNFNFSILTIGSFLGKNSSSFGKMLLTSKIHGNHTTTSEFTKPLLFKIHKTTSVDFLLL